MEKLVLLFFFMFTFIYNNITYAADFSTGREGEIIRPLDPAKVSLLKEEITVKVNLKKADFTIKTYVKNLGPSIELFVGYPAEEVNSDEKTIQSFHDFLTYIDGKVVPIMVTNSDYEEALPEDPKYNQWFLWPIMLDTGQIKEITNLFWTENKYDSVGNAVTGFILKPAKFWHGKPQSITLRYNFDTFEPYAVNSAFPANYYFEGDTLVFNFNNELPTTDIKISFNPDYEFQMLGLPITEIRAFWDAKTNKQYSQGLKHISNFATNKALTADARNALLVQKAILVLEKGEIQKAEELLVDALQREVPLSAIYYHLADIYAQRNDQIALEKLHLTAIKRKTNPLILRKIESYLPNAKRIFLPEFRTVNPLDITRFTAEIEDKNADIQKISLQVFSKDNNITKILSEKDINLAGQAYRYYINENIKLPVYVNNAYSRLIVYDGSGKKVEKTLPLNNRKNKILTTTTREDSVSLVSIIIILVLVFLIVRTIYKRYLR